MYYISYICKQKVYNGARIAQDSLKTEKTYKQCLNIKRCNTNQGNAESIGINVSVVSLFFDIRTKRLKIHIWIPVPMSIMQNIFYMIQYINHTIYFIQYKEVR